MKTRHFVWLVIIVIFIESCQRSFTPYEAANNPRGRKCATIR